MKSNNNRKYSLSVIVPAYNEIDNIKPLAREFKDFLAEQRFQAEIIIVDDGSDDGTADMVREIQNDFPFLKLVEHRKNRGKTAAIVSGLRVCEGKRIAVFDADLQYDPWDLKKMMDKLDEGYGMVSGIKQGKYQKPFVSKIYNWLTRKLFGLDVHDMNSLKLFRSDVMNEIFLRKDWHRFMVVLAYQRGYSVAEIPVTLRPRLHGEAKYGGFKRIFIGVTDLVAVWLSEKVFAKPMLLLGSTGIVFWGLAFLLGILLLVLRFGFNWGYPPLQTVLLLLVLFGGFFLTLGFLAEANTNLRDRVEFLLTRNNQKNIEKVVSISKKPQKRKLDNRKKPRSSHSDSNRDRRNPNPEKDSRRKSKKSIKPEKRNTQPKTEEKPKNIEKREEKPSQSGIKILKPSRDEIEWGRTGKRTRKTSVKGSSSEAFSNAKRIAKEIDENASIGFSENKANKDRKDENE